MANVQLFPVVPAFRVDVPPADSKDLKHKDRRESLEAEPREPILKKNPCFSPVTAFRFDHRPARRFKAQERTGQTDSVPVIRLAEGELDAGTQGVPSRGQGEASPPAVEDDNHEKVTGVQVDRVLRGGARLLQNAQGSDATYRLSEPVDHLDAFVSHNWCVSRVQKWIALSFHYNMSLALCASLLVGLPSAGLPLVGNVAVPVQLPLSAVCGMLAFFVFLFFGHDLVPFHASRLPTVFLDKVASTRQTRSSRSTTSKTQEVSWNTRRPWWFCIRRITHRSCGRCMSLVASCLRTTFPKSSGCPSTCRLSFWSARFASWFLSSCIWCLKTLAVVGDGVCLSLLDSPRSCAPTSGTLPH